MDQQAALRRIEKILSHISLSDENQNGIDLNQCAAAQIESAQSGNILDEERQKASFPIQEMIHLLNGGELFTEMRRMVGSMLENDEVLRDPRRFDMSVPEIRKRTMEKVIYVLKRMSDVGEGEGIPRMGKSKQGKRAKATKGLSEAFFQVLSLYDPSWTTRIGVHFGLFLNAIQGQGTEEQIKQFSEDVLSGRIFGCFAMTELGHGSYIRGFETTATFDIERQEFVINSPTETSTKWWIGMAGHTATHCVAFARLLTKGEDFGVHSFLVPLRNPDTGLALPGISIGDCGAKMGRNGIDNGWIQFHNVRVPRTNMLMRWAQVKEDGTYVAPPKAQMAYGALIGGRVNMIQDSADYAKKGLTIAVRYSAVRRQFPDPSKPDHEFQILNYQTHQHRIMPILATCYAFHFTAEQVRKKYEQVQDELQEGNILNLVGLHATSAGLKAFSTWWCNESLEQLRQCLGGHGYSSYSVLPSMLQDFAVMCTWEGDNTVMAQQTAKYLIKCLRRTMKGKPIHGFEKYIEKYQKILKPKSLKRYDLTDSRTQLKIFQRVSVRLLTRVNSHLYDEIKRGKTKDEAWNECLVELVAAARAHCDFFTVKCFTDAINELPESQEAIKKVLKKLSDLHAMYILSKYHYGVLLEDRYLTGHHTEKMRDLVRILCKEVRKDAVPLVDAFDFPDWVVQSPLGRYDGEVYKNYFEMVKGAPYPQPAPYWDEIIKPSLKQPRTTNSNNNA